jgi:hypothetical protein
MRPPGIAYRSLLTAMLTVSVLAAGAATSGPAMAGLPCAEVSTSASPGIVAPGDPETVSYSVTNCSGLTETITIGIKVAGPCGFALLRRFQLTMPPDQTLDRSVTFAAPSCEGVYTWRVTASKGALLDQAETTFKVCQDCQAN